MMRPPYVTAWSGERGYVVRPEPLLRGALALFCHGGRQGEGEPVWGRISEERQRRCVLLQLCQVCGQQLRGPGYLVGMPTDGTPASLPMRSHEPMVCAGCLPVSFSCPRVRRAHVAGQLWLVEVGHFGLAAHLLCRQPAAVEEMDVAVNQALDDGGHEHAIGFVEMLVQTGTIMPGQVLAELAAVMR